MPGHDPSQSPESEAEKLLADVRSVVPKVCKKLGYSPDQDAVEGLVSRVIVTLYDKDGKVLRSFRQRSKRRTWLYPIAKSIVLHRIEDQKRMVALEDTLPEFLIVRPDLEERLARKEKLEKVLSAVAKLTAHEQRLFYLMLRDLAVIVVSATGHALIMKPHQVARPKSLKMMCLTPYTKWYADSRTEVAETTIKARDLKPEEVAKEMEITKGSASTEMSVLKKKLRRMVTEK